ncbi:MAG: hypothetical protein ACFFDH_25880 [Promethearchaeota archaeon]
MNKKSKYSIYLAFVGVILIVIGFFSPINIPLGSTEYFWIWGLYGSEQIEFLEGFSLQFILTIVVCSSIIIISIFLSIIQIYKNRNYPEDSSGLLWLILGCVIIVTIIYFSIAIHYELFEYYAIRKSPVTTEPAYSYHRNRFWSYNDIGYGVILPICGALILIIVGILRGIRKNK